MIISVEKAKELIDFKGWTDSKIEHKLKAVEQTIRAYTHNNFQDRDCRKTVDIIGGLFVFEANNPFEAEDTVMVTETKLNKGLFTVIASYDTSFEVAEAVKDEERVLVTKVHYPEDVIECAINLLEWDVNNRAKVGVQSETLSRHSVTYFSMDGNNSVMGYPVSLLGCLKAYKKARF